MGEKHQPTPKSSGSFELISCAVLFCITSSTLLLVNKFALSYYGYPNMVLLLQLASSALLARLFGGMGWSQVDRLEWTKITASIPLTLSFYLALYTGMNALKHINVDTFILMKTCTPITVAIYEYLFASYSMPSTRTWLSLSLVVVFTAASFSTQIVGVSVTAACWLAAWFLSLTFYMIYAVHYVSAVQLTVMGRVFYDNLLSCVPAVGMVLARELQPGLVLGLWGWGGAAVLASCVMGFAMSGLSWNLRRSISALSHTVLGVTNKLLAVVLNSVVWDKHGPILSQVLLVLGILSSTMYQQPIKSKAAHNRLTHSRLLLATAAAACSVVALVWVGATLGLTLHDVSSSSARDPSSSTHALKGVRIHVADIPPVLMHQLMAGEAVAAKLLKQAWTETHLGDDFSSGFHWDLPTVLQKARGGGSTRATDEGSGGSTHRSMVVALAGSSGSSGSSSSSDAADYIRRLTLAASKPFQISIMNSLFWTIPAGSIGNCSLDGVPLDCRVNLSGENAEHADVLYYHIPGGVSDVLEKQHPNQLRLGMSLESGAYYPELDDPNHMCKFDAEMSFRTCSQVVNWYSVEAFHRIFQKPLAFERKKHAVAYVNSNCNTLSDRRNIMFQLMRLPNSRVPVHSLGRCDTNTPWPGGDSKGQVFQQYKFCVAMENSIRYDYLTEKIWDALIAGCIPIYMGTPDVYRFMPHPNAVIVYGPGGNATTPEELDELMHAIGSDKARYESMVAWKHQPVEQLAPLFRYLYSIKHLSGECHLCRFLAQHRMDPKPRYTTCLFNETWMAAAGQKVVNGSCRPSSSRRRRSSGLRMLR